MNLKPDQLRRLRAYVLSANATMGQIPRPVPPRPQLGADGPTFDTRDMYLSYSRLPTELQELAAISHAMCETALECQSGAATHAFMARCLLMANVVQRTDLARELGSLYDAQPTHEYLTLVPGEAGEAGEAGEPGEPGASDEFGDEQDADDQLVAEVERDVEIYLRRRLAQRDAAAATELAAAATEPAAMPAAATAVEPVVPVVGAPVGALGRRRMWAASAVVMAASAVVMAALLAWQHLVTPAPTATATTTHSINQSIQAGDLAAIVSHTERINNITEVHVQVVNFGSEPMPASLSLGQDDRDPPAGPAMVPARSTQHRVLRVREDRGRTKAMKVQFANGKNMLTIDL